MILKEYLSKKTRTDIAKTNLAIFQRYIDKDTDQMKTLKVQYHKMTLINILKFLKGHTHTHTHTHNHIYIYIYKYIYIYEDH